MSVVSLHRATADLPGTEINEERGSTVSGLRPQRRGCSTLRSNVLNTIALRNPMDQNVAAEGVDPWRAIGDAVRASELEKLMVPSLIGDPPAAHTARANSTFKFEKKR